MLADGFHWGLSDSKSPQVSRTRLRVLAVLSNAVVWIVSNHLLTSKSSRSLNNHLVIVRNPPITISTTVTFMFHCFFNYLARSRYYYYYYYFTSCELFTSTLAIGLLLESEWPHVTSGFQDSSKYCGQSQQCYSLGGLDSSSDFLLFQVFSKTFGTMTSVSITIGISYLHVLYISSFLARSYSLLPFRFQWSSLCGQQARQSPQISNYFFVLLMINRYGLLAAICWPLFHTKFQ